MKTLVCIVCPQSCTLTLDGTEVSGARCNRGVAFAQAEQTAPMRVVCSTVATGGEARLPVRTAGEVPKSLVFSVMRAIKSVKVSGKVVAGDVVLQNVCGSGVDVIATDDL